MKHPHQSSFPQTDSSQNGREGEDITSFLQTESPHNGEGGEDVTIEVDEWNAKTHRRDSEDHLLLMLSVFLCSRFIVGTTFWKEDLALDFASDFLCPSPPCK